MQCTCCAAGAIGSGKSASCNTVLGAFPAYRPSVSMLQPFFGTACTVFKVTICEGCADVETFTARHAAGPVTKDTATAELTIEGGRRVTIVDTPGQHHNR